MLYNSFGVIDESAIERISFVAELGKFFGFMENKFQFSDFELSKYFPELIWVLWDFSFELAVKDNKHIEGKDYLEMCL